MSTLEEHMQEQAEITESWENKYDSLSPICQLAVDYGMEIEVAGDDDSAIEYLSEYSLESESDFRIYDEAVNDRNDHIAEIATNGPKLFVVENMSEIEDSLMLVSATDSYQAARIFSDNFFGRESHVYENSDENADSEIAILNVREANLSGKAGLVGWNEKCDGGFLGYTIRFVITEEVEFV